MASKINLKLKTPIIMLSIAALVFRIIGSVSYFVNYDYMKYEFKITVAFPPFFSLISLVIELAPIVLFLIYIFKFYKNLKATFCVPIVFGLIAFAPIYNSIIRTLMAGERLYFADLIFNLFIVVPFLLATISALKGFSKKTFIIIALSISFLFCAFSVIAIFFSIGFALRNGQYIYSITSPCSVLGTILLYISLFLFAMNNRIPAILTPSPEQIMKNIEKMSPEQSLKLLKDNLEFGTISEEEYQRQRAKIIRKL